MIRCLELGRDQAGRVLRGDGEGDQRRRDVHIVERAAHRVLAADRAEAQLLLRSVCAQQGGKRLAEALRVLAQPLEVFLEGEVGSLEVAARRDELGNRLNDRRRRAEERVLLGIVGIKAERHDRCGLALAVQGGHGRRHDLRRGELVLAAERHEHRVRADRAVEPLDQAALEADAERGSVVQQLFLFGIACGRARDGRRGQGSNFSGHMLGAAVGVEEIAGNVHNQIAVPGHAQAVFVGHDCDLDRLEVFLCRRSDERVRVLSAHNDRHAFLRLGDGKLGAVQTVVLLGYSIQVNVQAVGQLADGDRYTARAEVVAAADHAGDVAVAEQALDLALLGRVALLHFSAAGLERSFGVLFGGTGGAAAAVAAGLAAEQDDHVAGFGHLADDILQRGRADHRADLHALGDITRVIDLMHQPGREADLVAVGRIARRRGLAQLALGQLVLERLGERDGRVARAGHAHRLIDVAAAGERVADRAAKAGRRAAERLDLGRVVVRLVLEHEQPVLIVAVYERLDLDRAGVDLLGFIDVPEVAALFEHLRACGRNVHQRDRALCGLFLTIDLDARRKIAVERVLHHRVVDLCAVDLGQEGGVAAVVGPVGVHHAHLGDGRVALFLIAEIGLQKLQVIQVHCKAHVCQQGGEGGLIHVDKAGDGRDRGRDRVLDLEGRGLVHGRFARLDRVDQIAADLVHIRRGQLALEHIDLGRRDRRALAAGQQLDALGAGVRALVELAGQRLDREHGVSACRTGEVLVIALVRHRLGKYNALCLFVGFGGKAFGVVAAQVPHMGQAFDLQKVVQAGKQAARLDVKAGLFFGITTIDAHVSCPLLCFFTR